MIKIDIGARLERTALVVLAIVCGATASVLMSRVASAQPGGTVPLVPQGAPGITVSLPIDSMDISVPIGTVLIKPVMTTLIDSTTTGGHNLIGFQGDFVFDSTVVTFATAYAQAAGLTAGPPSWTIAGNIEPGGGPTSRIARISAFVSDGATGLNGAGTLFNLRMLRVSSTPGASTALTWQPDPDNFYFTDDNLNSVVPQQTNGLIPVGPTCELRQWFEGVTTLVPGGWVMQNLSQPGPGTTGWFQGSTAAFTSQSGAANSYIAANYDNGTGTSTLSNWLLTPPLTLQNGATMTFWTRTVTAPALPDRLQVRMSTNGTSTNVGATATSVGDFQTLLLDINPTYTLTDYPNTWTQFTVTVSGLGSPTTGRMAFRYFVENGGPTGANSDYIGIDTVQYACNVPPTPTPTPTSPPINISGTISYCSNPVPGPVANVMLILTGSASGSTMSDSSGNYQFTSLAPGGSYTVTPSKAALTPGSAGINTADVIATQRHFVSGTPLSGCQLTAADVNGNGVINTVDVIAIQRFFLGLSTGIANVGKYQFIPANRTYPGVITDQTGQNYDTLVFGDVASHFVE